MTWNNSPAENKWSSQCSGPPEVVIKLCGVVWWCVEANLQLSRCLGSSAVSQMCRAFVVCEPLPVSHALRGLYLLQWCGGYHPKPFLMVMIEPEVQPNRVSLIHIHTLYNFMGTGNCMACLVVAQGDGGGGITLCLRGFLFNLLSSMLKSNIAQ